MNRYTVVSTIGEGSYGTVLRCRSRVNGGMVAIKKFKGTESSSDQRNALREARVLMSCHHENIVKLYEAFKRKGRLYLVFECCEQSLLELLEAHEHGIGVEETRFLMYQLIKGLAYLHSRGIVHRDVKPENVLLIRGGDTPGGRLKLCDFGFARFVTTPPIGTAGLTTDAAADAAAEALAGMTLSTLAAQEEANDPADPMTDYVATRWYRAPELLLGAPDYSYPVDIWAAGCILGELTDGQPLLPGASDVDQIHITQKLLGPLPHSLIDLWRRAPPRARVPATAAPAGGDYSRPDTLERRYFGKMGRQALSLITSMLCLDPARRPTATQCLMHPFFNACRAREHTAQVLNAPTTPVSATNSPRDGRASPAENHARRTPPLPDPSGRHTPSEQDRNAPAVSVFQFWQTLAKPEPAAPPPPPAPAPAQGARQPQQYRQNLPSLGATSGAAYGRGRGASRAGARGVGLPALYSERRYN